MLPSSRPRPAPPYSVGIAVPNQPALATSLTNSNGYSCFQSFSLQYCNGNRLASLRPAALITLRPSVSSNSMPVATFSRYKYFDLLQSTDPFNGSKPRPSYSLILPINNNPKH